MQVRMKVKISGTRDGVEWPDRGEIVDLPDGEAVALLAQGSAEPVGEGEPETATAKGGGDDVPAKSAARQVWVDYALAKGVAEADLEGVKRDDIAAVVTAFEADSSAT